MPNDLAQETYGRLFPAGDRLSACVPALCAAHAALVHCFENGGKLLVCGNGGSFADSLHLAGELLKSFECQRPLEEADKTALSGLPHGEVLAAQLEQGLPALVLGANGALTTALINDKSDARLVFAQECQVWGRAGDVLLGISTSGNAVDVIMAMSVARMKKMKVMALTGEPGGEMAKLADIAIRAPGDSTARIQESHVRLYHALCAGVERRLFG